jgi:hypothetical protein
MRFGTRECVERTVIRVFFASDRAVAPRDSARALGFAARLEESGRGSRLDRATEENLPEFIPLVASRSNQLLSSVTAGRWEFFSRIASCHSFVSFLVARRVQPFAPMHWSH